MESKKTFPLAWQILAYGLMIVFTVLTVGPLIWLVYSSFKPHPEIVRNIFSLPTQMYVENYTRAWKLGNLGIYSVNSILYSTTATIVSTVLALAAGYGIAKFGYRSSGPIYAFFLMGLLLTVHSILVPLFVMETKLGIDNTRIGIILPYIAFGLPFLLFLATSFIKGLPAEIEEAAIIDGASYLGVFWNVILPMSRPVVATMLIFRFLANWNEFVFVFVLTSKTAIRTLPVGINAFAGGMTRDYGMQFAALVIGTLPMIIFYTIFHKRLQQGFASGALKG
jgi:raffinose/stachyose/melibiose transport system permease protein